MRPLISRLGLSVHKLRHEPLSQSEQLFRMQLRMRFLEELAIRSQNISLSLSLPRLS